MKSNIILASAALVTQTLFATEPPKAIPPTPSVASALGSAGQLDAQETLALENDYMKRIISVKDGILTTSEIVNKRANTSARPSSCPEFRLRLSEGTETTGTDKEMTSADFTVVNTERYVIKASKTEGVAVTLKSDDNKLQVIVYYEIEPDDFYMRKFLKITSEKPIAVEQIDVEVMSMEDADQPYRLKCIYAQGKWSPGLGQPLYTTRTGTFWGIEFPAAYNFVRDKSLTCGYLWGRKLNPGKPYTTYKAVVGVSDDPTFNQEVFFDYINRVRVRPLRLQVQYNSWFDFADGVSREKFCGAVSYIHNKLVEERGCKPLKAYVIDDGWQDTGKDADWTDKTWKVNSKFDKDFATSFRAVKDAQSTLGLWMSPGCNFGALPMVPRYKAKGFEALSNYMSLAGPKYMGLLEDRMVELTTMGVTFFKLDGLFGHLNTRDFELNGESYGLPSMPQLGAMEMNTSDKKLNDAKYDEMKTYYLVAGTERLMKIFAAMAKAKPDVYIVISNGAYLSPWWLMHVDSSWMIMAGDAAGGADRTGELTYRDGVYHEIVSEERTQFPICAIFNHEPKKTQTGESKEIFRKYLYMNMSRGTGFIELYLNTPKLSTHDWDVLAEGIQWAHEIFPTFTRSRMHGGNPKKQEVYGYTAWLKDQGYVSIHNPSDEKKSYTITLDRAFGLIPASGTFMASSPIEDYMKGLRRTYSYGDTITFELEPKEIRIINFDKSVRDWSALRALQERTPYTAPQPTEAKKPPKNHPTLGASATGEQNTSVEQLPGGDVQKAAPQV
jgi:hypothetical protein